MGTFGSIGVQLRLSTSLMRYIASQRCQLHHAIIVMLLLLRFQETFTLCPTQNRDAPRCDPGKTIHREH